MSVSENLDEIKRLENHCKELEEQKRIALVALMAISQAADWQRIERIKPLCEVAIGLINK